MPARLMSCTDAPTFSRVMVDPKVIEWFRRLQEQGGNRPPGDGDDMLDDEFDEWE